MTYRLEVSEEVEGDLEAIAAHLHEAYLAFGSSGREATERAVSRIRIIRSDILGLAARPHRGTRHSDIAPGLRHVTLNRAIIWFEIDEDARCVRVLAVFFGGQDHHRHMLRRMGGAGEDD